MSGSKVIDDIEREYTLDEHLQNKKAYDQLNRKLDICFGELKESLEESLEESFEVPEPDVPGQRKYVDIPRTPETTFVHEIISKERK